MSESTQSVRLTSDMTYAHTLVLLAEAWPNLSVMLYRPTIEHYKEGYPTAEELELAPEERLLYLPDRSAAIRGDMNVQDFHATMSRSFSVETIIRGIPTHLIWMVSLDEANAGVRRSTHA
jgi:hypothetical protein